METKEYFWPKVMALLGSRRFWAVMGSVVFVVGNDALGMNLDEQSVQNVVLAVSSWVVAQSLKHTPVKR